MRTRIEFRKRIKDAHADQPAQRIHFLESFFLSKKEHLIGSFTTDIRINGFFTDFHAPRGQCWKDWRSTSPDYSLLTHGSMDPLLIIMSQGTNVGGINRINYTTDLCVLNASVRHFIYTIGANIGTKFTKDLTRPADLPLENLPYTLYHLLIKDGKRSVREHPESGSIVEVYDNTVCPCASFGCKVVRLSDEPPVATCHSDLKRAHVQF